MRLMLAAVVFLCLSVPSMYAQAGPYGEWQKGCNAGDGDACKSLGFWDETGAGEIVGQQKDLAQAAVWYGRAVAIYRRNCDSGKLSDCVSLGDLYSFGIMKDLDRTVALFHKGCDGGDIRGCLFLGYLYRDGKGVSKDAAQAVALIRKGCDGGIVNGCVELGKIYRDGIGGTIWTGVMKDTAQAVTLFLKACDSGNADGCLFLGEVYDSGDGVPQNKPKAVELYRKACTIEDYSQACDKLK
jgi:TPR repeat protein